MKAELIQYIEKNSQKHYALALSYVKNPEDAMDIVQDTIIKAIEKVGQLKNPQFMGTWFCRILINNAQDFLKNSAKVIPSDPVELIQEQGKEDLYRDFDLENALNQLKDNERQIVDLRFYAGASLEEIANTLHLNENTVKTTLYRSLKKLRKIMEEE